MDMGEEETFGLEKRSENTLNCHPPNMNTDWQFGSSNHTNDNSITIGKGDLIMGSSTCSSVSMVDSFSPNLWGHPSSQNLNLCDSNVPKGIPNSFGTSIDNLGWNPTNSVPKTSIFSPPGVGMLHDSLSHFPADSGFIERAARFSCFNNRSFSDMVNPFNISESLNLHSKNGGSVHGSSAFHFDGLNPITSSHSPMNELSTTVVAKAVSVDRGSVDGSPLKSDIKAGNVPRTPDESKIESDGAEFSGGAGGLHEPSSSKGLNMKKRKRGGQVHDSELDQGKEAANDNVDPKQKDDQAPSSTGKANKHGKDSTEAQDPPKQDYIHVRARRGQATNSHSLAERVRREKISERMKYLQDLVPGCSKVTGKAVMLDEIINYVQSLQRQVEFLSMKLATVNPRIDLNIEGLLAKDILQSRLGPSSMGFSPDMDMGHPQFNPLQPGLFREGVPGIANASDELRRTINSQLMAMNAGYKEPNSQIPHVWDDELNRVIQMNFEAGVPLNGQESSGPSTPGHMKVEH